MMTTFINWAGSRKNDLSVIGPLIPKDIETFVDPFVGDGACYLAAQAHNYAVADRNQDLIDCWRTVQISGPRFRTLLKSLRETWNSCDSAFESIKSGFLELRHSVDGGLFADYPSKVNAIKRIVDKVSYEDLFDTAFTEPLEFHMELRHQTLIALEQMNADTDEELAEVLFFTAFKAAVFQYLVEVYNKPESKNTLRSALLIFLMEYARADKFVQDAGQFRLEYSGRRANNHSIIERMMTAEAESLADKMAVTRTYCQDIFRSLGFPFAKAADSFLFLDVPKELKEASRKRLAEFLKRGTESRWMVICPAEDILTVILDLDGTVKNSVPLGKEVVLMNY